MRPISIISGQNALRAYDDNGIAYGASPISEYVLIDTGQIASGQTKIIDFTPLGYDIVIDSIWTLATADNTDIHVDIITPSMTSSEKLYRITLQNNSINNSIPFLALDTRYRLRITAVSAVVNVLMYGRRVQRILGATI